MLLSQTSLENIKSTRVEKPTVESFNLPERVLQFGTGVLLRGLPDYFIDKANKQGVFNGRILVVKSTSSSGVDAFEQQDNLYTICVKGIENGTEVVKHIINNSIARVCSANNEWSTILEAAKNPELKVVISNTTEVGITLSHDKISDSPPASFPGKLLSFLHQRYQHFEGKPEAGLVILPTELISDNATKLKNILLNLSEQNSLDQDFIEWLQESNDFCNTLVDRIVPGKLPSSDQKATEEELGYQDELMIMAEPFRLWAIESTSERVKDVLSFAQVDSSIVLTPSIDKFKEIKLRLLNGTHTLSCAVALLSELPIVKQAMGDAAFNSYVKTLMRNEIGKSILSQNIEQNDVEEFSASVIDRFSNPYLDHKWENIALNFSSKMNMRAIPLLDKWYGKNNTCPTYFALGFAAYVKFMDTQKSDDKYIHNINGHVVTLQDEFAPLLHDYWQDPSTAVHKILKDDNLWGKDLTKYAGFETTVTEFLSDFERDGVIETVKKVNAKWQVEY